jgi:hypothetical protein
MVTGDLDGLAEEPAVSRFLLQGGLFFLLPLSKSSLFTRHHYRGGLTVTFRHPNERN